ncbi:MAG TPA: hypothetical protein VMF66_05920 [Candidatus Acidoferrum sp.]|nr:hypothetical protein [Candidatus Acidoferrum sp.]
MQRQFAIPVVAGLVGLCVLGVPSGQTSAGTTRRASSAKATLARPSSAVQASEQASEWQVQDQSQVPTQAELDARAKVLVANQHADDKALEQYEFVERQIDRTGGAMPEVLQDRTFRVVPTGTGTLKILLRSDGKAAAPDDYRRQLHDWERVLELALNPDDPRAQTAYAKWQKKQRDRAALVEATQTAFIPKWVGRETVDGRDCDAYSLVPNPKFHPQSMLQEALTHFTARVWVDHNANQVVHAEAKCIRDISVGGGILGKLYRGGVFSFDQVPVAEGIWLPARYQYDFTGRKFLFLFRVHQVVESSHYRRVGPPEQALTDVKSEIAAGKTIYLDP